MVRPASAPGSPSAREHVHASPDSGDGIVTPGTVDSDTQTSSSRSDKTGQPSASAFSAPASSLGALACTDSAPSATGPTHYPAGLGAKRIVTVVRASSSMPVSSQRGHRAVVRWLHALMRCPEDEASLHTARSELDTSVCAQRVGWVAPARSPMPWSAGCLAYPGRWAGSRPYEFRRAIDPSVL